LPLSNDYALKWQLNVLCKKQPTIIAAEWTDISVFFESITDIISTSTQAMSSCPVNEVFYQNHCYYLDGSGGQCLPGYSLGSKTVLSEIANSFTGLNYKTQVSDNCCVKTLEAPSNYGSIGGQCNVQGPFIGGPSLNGGGCGSYAGLSAKQLTFCASN
jgi:hypothetical protein